MKNNEYDVVILGGGLAGLTLSLQLKQANPAVEVLVLERRPESAPEAAHKVGESTVELGTHYLREVLGLKDYLEEHQLPKHGLRFFFSPEHKEQIGIRVELGPRKFLPVPSHQIDRGTFENDLIDMSRNSGNEVLLGAKVINAEIADTGHSVTYSKDGRDSHVYAKWIVDTTGRGSFLKRKMGFAQEVEHDVNSAWFRVDHKVDIDEWCDDDQWHINVERGLRHLSTVHLMDKGYWVWIIPLAGDRTSIGIVADGGIHDFNEYNKLEKALAWIDEFEPALGREIRAIEEKILDFKVMKHFAHGSGELFSTDRWAVSGESGLFLDPFYSPGTDFIAISNTFTSDLILRDLKGEDVFLRTRFYTEVFRAVFDNWLPLYQGQYKLWGNTQTMVLKIFWDWAGYWSMNTLLFVNEGLTDLDLLRKVAFGAKAILQRYGELGTRMQRLFEEWAEYDKEEFTSHYFDPYDIEYLRRFQNEILEQQYTADEVYAKLEENMSTLEQIAAEIFRCMSAYVYGTPVEQLVDPYTVSLDPAKDLESPNSVQLEHDPVIAAEISKMWLYSEEPVS